MSTPRGARREPTRKVRVLPLLLAALIVLPNNPFVASAAAQALSASRPAAPAGAAGAAAAASIPGLSAPSALTLAPLGLSAPASAAPAPAGASATPASALPASRPSAPAAAAAPAAPSAAASVAALAAATPGAATPAAPAREKGARAVDGAAASGRTLFDGSRDQAALEAVLGGGTVQPNGGRIAPFGFKLAGAAPDSPAFKARGAGLEGFLASKREVEGTFGRNAFLHHLDDYFRYLTDLLAPMAGFAAADRLSAQLKALQETDSSAAEKNARLDSILGRAVADMQGQLTSARPSSWLRDSRTYVMFSRAHNLPGWRAWRGLPAGAPGQKLFADFSDSDLAEIKKNFDSVWLMGIFPIGERGRLGDAGGSPYSIKDHAAVNPEFGSEADLKALVARAHRAGLKVILDFVPNHTSLDSRLLAEHPEYFIHREVEGDPQRPPDGFFAYHSDLWGRWIWVSYGGYDSYGSRAYWKDTAQLDYSRQDTRDAMIGIVNDWIARTGVDGFRVDMAYQLTNDSFAKLWGKAMAPGEFLEQLTSRVRRDHPGAAFVAEVYDRRTQISAMGFDSLYNKNNIDTAAGQYGWYDAWMHGDAGWIRSAIRDAAFLIWQKGVATGSQFIGNPDESSPQRQEVRDGRPVSGIGRNWRAAALMTLMLPGSLLFYGSQEAGFDKPDPKDFPKAMSFQSQVSVDWAAHPEIAAEFDSLFAQAKEIRATLGAPAMEPLEPADGSPWAGYLLKPTASSPEKDHFYAVIANPTDRDLKIRIARPDLGLDVETTLAAGRGQVLRLPIRAQTASAPGRRGESGQAQPQLLILLAGLAATAALAVWSWPFLAAHFAVLVAHYAAVAKALGWAANWTFLFFPVVQIAQNASNMIKAKRGGDEGRQAAERLAGVNTGSQSTLIAGNLLNFPSFLASGNSALITNALMGAGGSLAILGQLALSRRFSLGKWALNAVAAGAAVAVALSGALPAGLVAALGVAAAGVFAMFTPPQIRQNDEALAALSGSDKAKAATAKEALKGVNPLYLFVGMLGNLMLVPVFFASGHWYNVAGNIVGIAGPLYILHQLSKGGLFPKAGAALTALAVAAYYLTMTAAAAQLLYAGAILAGLAGGAYLLHRLSKAGLLPKWLAI